MKRNPAAKPGRKYVKPEIKKATKEAEKKELKEKYKAQIKKSIEIKRINNELVSVELKGKLKGKGAVSLWTNPNSPRAEISTLKINEPYQRIRIGEALVEKATRYLEERGFMWVETTATKMKKYEHPYEFYLKQGFIPHPVLYSPKQAQAIAKTGGVIKMIKPLSLDRKQWDELVELWDKNRKKSNTRKG